MLWRFVSSLQLEHGRTALASSKANCLFCCAIKQHGCASHTPLLLSSIYNYLQQIPSQNLLTGIQNQCFLYTSLVTRSLFLLFIIFLPYPGLGQTYLCLETLVIICQWRTGVNLFILCILKWPLVLTLHWHLHNIHISDNHTHTHDKQRQRGQLRPYLHFILQCFSLVAMALGSWSIKTVKNS